MNNKGLLVILSAPSGCGKDTVFKELKIGQSIWDELIPDTVSDGKDTEHNKETIRDRKEQPVR